MFNLDFYFAVFRYFDIKILIKYHKFHHFAIFFFNLHRQYFVDRSYKGLTYQAKDLIAENPKVSDYLLGCKTV